MIMLLLLTPFVHWFQNEGDTAYVDGRNKVTLVMILEVVVRAKHGNLLNRGQGKANHAE